MNQSEIILIFVILSFSLGLSILMKRDSIPPRMLRPLAIISAFMVLFSFGLVVYSFFV
jgi:hypothetical protein